MLPMKKTATAIAGTSGQGVCPGKCSRWSGKASMVVVANVSAARVTRPVTCDGVPGGSHNGSRPCTTGTTGKFGGAGGEDVAHSSVPAPHGFSSAIAPARYDVTTLI